MYTREFILKLITEEKELFSEYSQLCARYQSQPDMIIVAKHQAKIEVLQKILQTDPIIKN